MLMTAHGPCSLAALAGSAALRSHPDRLLFARCSHPLPRLDRQGHSAAGSAGCGEGQRDGFGCRGIIGWKTDRGPTFGYGLSNMHRNMHALVPPSHLVSWWYVCTACNILHERTGSPRSCAVRCLCARGRLGWLKLGGFMKEAPYSLIYWHLVGQDGVLCMSRNAACTPYRDRYSYICDLPPLPWMPIAFCTFHLKGSCIVKLDHC